MPELAEVDYYRHRWDAGHGEKILGVHLNAEKRVFRGNDLKLFARLVGTKLTGSESGGKQMLFRFSGGFWLGIHLGMTGKLAVANSDHPPEKHDHLVLYQKKRALVFTDARQFGRVRIDQGDKAPPWWEGMAAPVSSRAFTLGHMTEFLTRHGRLTIKGALLHQKGFPGIGNWMADEVLWRAGVAPHRLSSKLTKPEMTRLHKEVRFVAREALKKIGPDFGDPPKNWLFHERWSAKGVCPKHGTALVRETIGGRTTAWCRRCQK